MFSLFVQFTCGVCGFGCRVTFPSSLSSSESIPAFSAYNFNLTTGRGCTNMKSPWVFQLGKYVNIVLTIIYYKGFSYCKDSNHLLRYTYIGFEASTCSVCNFPSPSTSIVQYTILLAATDFSPSTPNTTTFSKNENL